MVDGVDVEKSGTGSMDLLIFAAHFALFIDARITGSVLYRRAKTS